MKNIHKFKFNCDRLWKLWYSILVILMQTILICFAISHYMICRSQAFDPRFGNQWSHTPLNLQLAAIILSLSLLIWLVYSCLLKVGHPVNDGVELGLDLDSIKQALTEIGNYKGLDLFKSRLTIHALPYNGLIHLLISLILALPVSIMQAEQIRNEAISPEYIWITNIDFLLNPHTSHIVRGIKPMCHKVLCEYPIKPLAISPEFLNLVVSLLIIIIRLPSPFWYTNKAFSILFSCFAFVTAVCIVIEYESLILIIKVIYNYQLTELKIDIHMPVWVILIIFFFKCLLMLFMLVIVFEYGYVQYLSNMRKYRQYLPFEISDSVSQQSINNHKINCYQVAPRILGSIALILVKVLKIPLLYIQILYFKQMDSNNFHPMVIVSICVSFFYFLTCLFLWFGFVVKSKWQFHINLQTNHMPNVDARKLTGSPEPIYGCFYNAPSGSSQTSMSKPMLRSSMESSDYSSQRMSQSANYVYMQTGMNSVIHAMPINEQLEYNPVESEASFYSNTKSNDSGDNRYNRPLYPYPNMENSQYTTLASLQSGVMMTGKALSDTSSNENFSKNYSRRGSNRVTFKEENNTIDSNYPFYNYINNSGSKIPDILSVSNVEKSDISELPSNPHGFDPNLEMSTDMRQKENMESGGRDPRLCSQV